MTIRILMAAAFAVVPLAAVSAPRPWTAVATPVATGSYVIGNPKARVRLVEVVSYTCPHCAHLVAESKADVTRMVQSGVLAVEVRNQVHDKLDLVATATARCAGPAAFPALHEALLAKQAEWVPQGAEWDQENAQRLALYPDDQKLKALADGAGVTALAKAAGAPPAAIDACFADDAVQRALAVSQTTMAAHGTPSFYLNGKLIENVTWAQLKPMLASAGAK